MLCYKLGVMEREAVCGQEWILSQAISDCSALSQEQVSEESVSSWRQVRAFKGQKGTYQELEASWEQDVGPAVQVRKRKGKEEVRP